MNLKNLRKENILLVGGKCSNLGELHNLNVNIAPGFAITVDGYRYFLHGSGILDSLSKLIRELNSSNSKYIASTCQKIKKLIINAPMPSDLMENILKEYENLGQVVGVREPEVAVRSSAITEDSNNTSFAGQYDSYLFVKRLELISQIKNCFASMYNTRAITYSLSNNHVKLSPEISVGIQHMINGKTSGVGFSINPVSGDHSTIIVESAWGLGESIVQGTVDPDLFYMKKSTLEIVKEQIARKKWMSIRKINSSENTILSKIKVPKELQNISSISKEQLIKLTNIIRMLEKHYHTPIDVEWTIDSQTDKLYLMQVRPETVWSKNNALGNNLNKDFKKNHIKTNKKSGSVQ